MKLRKLLPLGAALLAMGLSLSSPAVSPARADDEDTKDRTEKKIIRIRGDQDVPDRDSGAGYLGVQVQRLTDPLRRARGIPKSVDGTLISNVEDNGPADQAGLKRGDVILAVNRDETESPSDLIRVVRDLNPGSRVPVEIWRNGSSRTVPITVGSRPDRDDLPASPPMPGWEGSDGPGGGVDNGTRMQIFRRDRVDLERQLRDIQDQLSKLREEDFARLEREIRQLRADLLRERGLERRDRDQREDRDRDNDEDD